MTQFVFFVQKICQAFALLIVTSFAIAKDLCAIDDSGIKLCLSSPPKRIISLAPGSTELLYAAGAEKQLLAVDQYSDYPPEVKELPKVGGHPNVSVETLISMKPDLVVVWTGGNSPKLIEQLETVGLTLFRLHAVSLKDIENDIRKLGVLTGNIQQANKSASAFRHRLTHLKAAYQQQAPVSVFFEIWRSPLMAVGSQHVMDSVITLCGGRNIFADAGSNFPVISIESLLSRNPDVILTGSSRDKDHQTAMARYWSNWPMLSAVQKSQLFMVKSDLITRPTPRILEGAEQICHYLQTVRAKNNPSEPTPDTAKSSDIVHKDSHVAQ